MTNLFEIPRVSKDGLSDYSWNLRRPEGTRDSGSWPFVAQRFILISLLKSFKNCEGSGTSGCLILVCRTNVEGRKWERMSEFERE